MQRLSITYKLTFLLALLSTAPLGFLVFNRSSDEIEASTRSRLAACEQLALSCALQLKHPDYRAINYLMEQFTEKAEEVVAVRLIRFDGLVIHQVGTAPEFSQDAQPARGGKLFGVPILRSGKEWGSVETVYRSDLASGQLWQVGQALVATMSLNLLTFGLLLRRSLAVLNSGNAVPKRVRNTLDTIVGGVVILDASGKIVMANEAFQSSCKRTLDELLGSSLEEIPFRCEQSMLPWDQARAEKTRQSGATLFLEDGSLERCFVVNATPIFGANDAVAGALISFEDVTSLEQQKQSLLLAMAELETSKERIHQQNLRLKELASRDVLTGAFNRRSLYEQLEVLWHDFTERGQSLNCIMFDVDHFKKLNDNHGHAVGDEVLKNVARTIQNAVTEPGFAGRYGGEEFCVVLPGMTVEQATAIGESIRQAIESQLAEPYRVTASLGVSGSEFGAASFQAIIEQADQALYAAKHAGRNAVRCWSASLVEESPETMLPLPATGDQPISYYAVASLHSALAYRDADTALHSQRVAEMAVSLARGLMTASQLYVLEIAAILHDIGKIGVPDSVLLKPGKLTPAEWKVMEAHAQIGVEIVESSFNCAALADMVRYHHFRYDGQGAPENAPVGEDIPLGARIICIVDAYDAMVSNRVYRKGRAPEQAFIELQRCAGSQFDPLLVDRFIAAQVGWRADSRFLKPQAAAKEAITIGHLTERTMHAFESQDPKVLLDSLEKMARTGELHDYPAITHLANELKQVIGDSRSDDWSFAMPLVQDLLDMCLMVQRAHIREVASRPQDVENCPQRGYYSAARDWWEADQV